MTSHRLEDPYGIMVLVEIFFNSYERSNCLCTNIDIAFAQEVSQKRCHALIPYHAEIFNRRCSDTGFGILQLTAERGDNPRCSEIAQNSKNYRFHPVPDSGKHLAELIRQGFVEYLVEQPERVDGCIIIIGEYCLEQFFPAAGNLHLAQFLHGTVTELKVIGLQVFNHSLQVFRPNLQAEDKPEDAQTDRYNRDNGDILCPTCKGALQKRWFCKTCYGKGYLDWIEQVVGVTPPLTNNAAQNVMIGYNSLQYCTTGHRTIAIGYKALRNDL